MEKSCCQPASAVLIYTLSRGSAEIGRQARLRILCPIGRVGSSPISRRNEPEAVELPVFLLPAKKTTCLTGGSEFGFSLDKKTSNVTMSVGLTPHYIEKQRRYPWIIVH